MSLSATQWCRKESKGLGTNNSWIRGWYLGNLERGTMRGSGWEAFNLAGRNQLTWENDKGKGSQKLSLKRWDLEALKEGGPKVSYLRTPQNGKPDRDFRGRNIKRKKLWEMWKRPATNVAGTAFVLVPRGANGGNQWYSGNPKMTL